jgi:hypothetical protein
MAFPMRTKRIDKMNSVYIIEKKDRPYGASMTL